MRGPSGFPPEGEESYGRFQGAFYVACLVAIAVDLIALAITH